MAQNRDEFGLIDALARASGTGGRGVVLGIGDDAAILRPPAARDLVASTDCQIAGVHFEWAWLRPRAIGERAAHVAFSDLAAMAADPWIALVSLSLPPSLGDADVIAVQRGIARGATDCGATIAGGNVSAAGARAPFAIHLTALGTVPKGAAIARGGARAGDVVFVSGRPGQAALGRHGITAGTATAADARAFRRPRARIALGRALRGVATAMVDLSDGLGRDLRHLLGARGATLQWTRLDPGPAFAARATAVGRDARALVFGGGDDYELCFTAPERLGRRVDAVAKRVGVRVRAIGHVTDDPAVTLVERDGTAGSIDPTGHSHR